ncbi:MAG: VCBS repeat-containing protein [Armatimonadetes bacterium]|nr:VCBS repeat-containing protein [Armatimonadota bacterium]
MPQNGQRLAASVCRGWLSGAVLAVACAALLPAPASVQSPAAPFAEHLLAGGYDYAYGLAAADLDRDGDLDLTSSDTVNNVLYWYENDGKANFRRRLVQENEPGWFERHVVGDVNGDRLPDIVVVKNLDGHVVWFEGNRRPADGPWRRHVVTTNCKRAYDVELVDLDRDGDLDVAASAWNGNHLAWFENPGRTGAEREWVRRVIAEEVLETRTIRAADINRDGRPDLLATARKSNLLVWYENPAQRDAPWIPHPIEEKFLSPTHGQLYDVDRDGDPDVVIAFGMLEKAGTPNTNCVAWYENLGRPGKGTVWQRHEVGELVGGFEAFAADLDGDRDVDLAATAWRPDGMLVWFENPGRPDVLWARHVLKENWAHANQVIAADLNGDRRSDLVASAERGANEVRWWENRGTGRGRR